MCVLVFMCVGVHACMRVCVCVCVCVHMQTCTNVKIIKFSVDDTVYFIYVMLTLMMESNVQILSVSAECEDWSDEYS